MWRFVYWLTSSLEDLATGVGSDEPDAIFGVKPPL